MSWSSYEWTPSQSNAGFNNNKIFIITWVIQKFQTAGDKLERFFKCCSFWKTVQFPWQATVVCCNFRALHFFKWTYTMQELPLIREYLPLVTCETFNISINRPWLLALKIRQFPVAVSNNVIIAVGQLFSRKFNVSDLALCLLSQPNLICMKFAHNIPVFKAKVTHISSLAIFSEDNGWLTNC